MLLCAWLVPLLITGQQVITDVFVTPQPRPSAQFPNWDRKDRVNILLLGLDMRTPGDARSDTMILISIDPAGKTVGMLSIPRDLWVTIPGHGEAKINAAYQYGLNGGDGNGGPALAEQTVEQNLGVPVHYFAQIDFQGFVRVVDAIDGVTVDVPKPLLDNEYPALDWSFMRIYVPAGLQHMDGTTALEYVRSRHADSDLGRNQRQQALLLAIKQRGLQLDILPRLNNLLQQLQGTVKTDLSLTQVGSLAQLAQQIPAANIHTYAIGADMVTDSGASGQDALIPDWDKIHALVRQMMGSAAVQNEAAQIRLLNGTNVSGLAARTQPLLEGAGLIVTGVAQAPDAGSYPQTVIVDYTGGQKPATIAQIRSTLNLGNIPVRTGAAGDRPPGVDLDVILGDDAAR